MRLSWHLAFVIPSRTARLQQPLTCSFPFSFSYFSSQFFSLRLLPCLPISRFGSPTRVAHSSQHRLGGPPPTDRVTPAEPHCPPATATPFRRLTSDSPQTSIRHHHLQHHHHSHHPPRHSHPLRPSR
ncbi:uncharacterized protein B0I36DRAFT_130213 [Microdochium trichocladiopsis]|uniref:Uncharacterized protein n=1 Tax=Microdochium trichocladiopsis TaxID=1682393 RepID=A0A9P8Y748_9PEZI|nr:uncharacterized protein B0I36DRAFT_130213 [Microdochium trichocladiopsis]KAH7029287.1 hypothetical protein B0I36DRAFT_130213 [Microdochium trichocladiopsis]